VPRSVEAAMAELGLSARAHDKVLRVARTIADLDSSEDIRPVDLNEAIKLPDVGPADVDVKRWPTEHSPMLKFEKFQSALFEFLEQLADNNNRPWFRKTRRGTIARCWSRRWRSSAPSGRD